MAVLTPRLSFGLMFTCLGLGSILRLDMALIYESTPKKKSPSRLTVIS